MIRNTHILSSMETGALCLKYNGHVSEFRMNPVVLGDVLSTKSIPKSYKRTKGHGHLARKHDFALGDKILALYAWEDGEAGDENKHELPPPIDQALYFGNAYVIGHVDDEQVDITEEDYLMLQNKFFEGEESLGSEDSWSSEESLADDDSLHDFIVPG